MKSFFAKALPNLPLLTFFMMAFWLLSTWVFVRLVHYEAQIRILPADAYQVELITTADYTRLQDPSLKEVELSNGTTLLDRQPVWYERALPNYKPVGDHYVLVTTLGTAHYYYRWITDALPLMMLTAFGLFVTYWDLRRRASANSGQ